MGSDILFDLSKDSVQSLLLSRNTNINVSNDLFESTSGGDDVGLRAPRLVPRVTLLQEARAKDFPDQGSNTEKINRQTPTHFVTNSLMAWKKQNRAAKYRY